MRKIKKSSYQDGLGQYFTPKKVADFMLELATVSTDAAVLEPACGEGVFLEVLQQKGFNQITAFEIDTQLAQNYAYVMRQSFVSTQVSQRFDLVIGNPPYIGWKKLPSYLKEELEQSQLWQRYCNGLCDYLYIFILKSIELLKPGGELIFICPEYWLNTTHSQGLRNYMMANGYFECIYHFSEAPIFEQARISTIVFKYVKSSHSSKPLIAVKRYQARQALTTQILDGLRNNKLESPDIEVFETPQFEQNQKWLLVEPSVIQGLQKFESTCQSTIGEECDIAHGLVSGLEKAFRLPDDLPLNQLEKQHLLLVVKGKGLEPFRHTQVTSCIFLNEVETETTLKDNFPNFYQHLQPFKTALENRYQYKRSIPYWHWVFLRSFQQFNQAIPRIFVPVKERITHKDYFRFAGVPAGLFPTQDLIALFPKATTKESLWYILAFLNSPAVFEWYKYNGIVKGGVVEFSERPLATIPFRTIDWDNPVEVALHQQITDNCKHYVASGEAHWRTKVTVALQQLLEE